MNGHWSDDRAGMLVPAPQRARHATAEELDTRGLVESRDSTVLSQQIRKATVDPGS